MNWRDVLAMPPAMKRVVPVTAALRAKRLREESVEEAMVDCTRCCVFITSWKGGGMAIVDIREVSFPDRKSGVR